MNDTVLLARDGTVATLTLNRPDVLNALDPAMVDALVAHTAEIAADDALRVVVVQGAGKHFMAGGDIRTFATHLDEAPATRRDGFRRMIEQLHAAIMIIRAARKLEKWTPRMKEFKKWLYKNADKVFNSARSD